MTSGGTSSRARELLRLLGSVADRFARIRLLAALLLVVASGVISGTTPIALKFVVDGLAAGDRAGPSVGIALLLSGYLVGQWLARAIGEVRWAVFGEAEQRVQRVLSRRLFEHIIRLPLSFHLERRTGALNQSVSNGLLGSQLVLQHLIFGVLPAVIELLTVVVVLCRFSQPWLLAPLVASAFAYTLVFARGTRQTARAAPLPRRQSPWRLATGTRSSFRRVGIVGSACAAADARARDHARSRALWQSCSGPNARDSPKMWIGAGSESPGLVSFGRYPPRPYSGFPFPLG